MSIESLDAVMLTAIFILPGFLMIGVMDSINPPKKRSEGVYFLKCLTLSIINCACWSWAYSFVLRKDFKQQFCYYLYIVLITVAGALVLAIIISIIEQRCIIKGLLSKLNVHFIHPVPTAWDYCFSNQQESFVIVTLTDGTQLFGWFSSNSFASSDADERDLFIEKGYKVGKDGKWFLDKESAGIYIPKDKIKFIELKKGGQPNE